MGATQHWSAASQLWYIVTLQYQYHIILSSIVEWLLVDVL